MPDNRCHYESPLGPMTMAGNDAGLTGLWFEQPGQSTGLSQFPPTAAVFDEARCWLDLYFSGRDPGFTPPLAPFGTAFQLAVWNRLLRIPFGKTRTYGQIADDLACDLARPHMSAQAVGGAVSRNPIILIIPCHRVIAAGGRLGGYAFGPTRKQWLLNHETSWQKPY